jgi:2-(1,2-epoxy-1,2-dihydrophenyl)acetyl-CoA isomerase
VTAPEAAPVLYAVLDGVAVVTLNRPDRLNASNADMSSGLTAAFSRAGLDPDVRVIVLRGAGRGFCAGADAAVLDALSAGQDTPSNASAGLRYDGFANLSKPVIAAIHGPCAGIGLAMACAADIRIAADNAFFLAPFAALGLCAEGGLAWSLSRLMGQGHATEMLLSARRIAAPEAYAKGLVSMVLPDEGFADAALDYAKAIAAHAPSSFAHIKRQMGAVDGQDFETARAVAAALVPATLGDPDFREAMTARREKRAPRFAPLTASFAPPVSQSPDS